MRSGGSRPDFRTLGLLGNELGIHLHEVLAHLEVASRHVLDPLATDPDVAVGRLARIAIVAAAPGVPRVGPLAALRAGKKSPVFGVLPGHPRDIPDADHLLAVLTFADVSNSYSHHD